MRTVTKVAVGLVLTSALAFAGKSNTGCGFGTVLFGEADGAFGDSLIYTTNGTSKPSSITTGTSECKQPSHFIKNEKLEKFMIANLDNIAADVAVGEGENLQTLISLLGRSDRNSVAVTLQNNFDKIFTKEDIKVHEVADNIAKVLS